MKPKYKVGDKFIYHYGQNSHIVYQILCVSTHPHWADGQYQYFVESLYDDGGAGRDHGYDMKRESCIDAFVEYNGKYSM